MRAPSSLRRKRNKPRRRSPVNCRLTTTEFEAMGGPGSREFSCLFSRRRPVLEAPAFEGVEMRGALGCGDADESRQAFEAAMIDRQSVVFRSAYKSQV